MATKTTILILLSLTGTAVLFTADVTTAASSAPAPAADCSSIILDMADCLSYVSGDATVTKPEGTCCSGLKKVLKAHVECLCEGFKNAAQFGVTLNMTRALDLPSACRVSAPPVSNCGLSIATGGVAPVLPEEEGAATNDCATVSYQDLNHEDDPVDLTFYDDPTLTYEIGNSGDNWDDKRREWLKHHPSFATGVEDRILLLTGSQPGPCKNPIGDHLLLRLFKNKVDYCRIHGYDIFYNNAFLNPKMGSWWTKMPALRATMLAHPEVEWIFWVDSDAVFTDIDFKPPLEKYKDHNLVVHGYYNKVYEEKNWGGVNAGVILIRNCQWSMKFLEVWAEMGPQTPNYEKWGQILTSTLSYKIDPESDDQSALVYLLLKEKETWGKKIYIENEYDLSGYWFDIINSFNTITDNYARIEKGVTELRRRHAEKVSEHYAAVMTEAFGSDGGRKRPFVTHFTACSPCSGVHWGYTDEQCWGGLERALNFADNQVLRSYGFVRPDLMNASSLSPLPFG